MTIFLATASVARLQAASFTKLATDWSLQRGKGEECRALFVGCVGADQFVAVG
jgi:hypothetical protein